MEKVIFSEGKIGNVRLKNRILFPSMCHYHCDKNGKTTPDFEHYVESAASSGVAVVMVPGCPYGPSSKARLSISGEEYREDWEKALEICRKYNAKLFVQLHPFKHHSEMKLDNKEPNNMPIEEIEFYIEEFAKGALRAKEFGIDGVELHGAHAHELAQFLSPYTNNRTDEYGGDVKNRAKFSIDMLKAMRQAVGEGYPLIFKISTVECIEGGSIIEDTIIASQLLEQAGASAIVASVGTPIREGFVTAPLDLPPAFNLENIKKIKKAVNIPVIAINRINDLDLANQIIENNDADFVAMGRAIVADPDIIKKYNTNKVPRKCLGCLQGCKSDPGLRLFCLQNPLIGRTSELKLNILPDELKDTPVIVVGAGIAGMECAISLAKRGFSPTIYEQSDKAGGLINLAALPPLKQGFYNLISSRLSELKELNIDIIYNTKLTSDMIKDMGVKNIVVATGTTPIMPKGILSSDNVNVFSSDDILKNPNLAGENVAIIGGGLVGCETAELLALQGKNISIIEMSDTIAKEIHPHRKQFFFERLHSQNIKMYTNTKLTKIDLPSIYVEEKGETISLAGFDTVVIAIGRTKSDDLEKELLDIGLNVFKISNDGSTNALKSIYEAHKIAVSM